MNLKGEIRESISLDDDDLSDVEDEVFIRDGKNGFKLAEELNVKRPLMAPRRRHGKYSSGSRLKPKPNCRTWCKPCCYIVASLSVLIGLIVLVVVLVSIYPLPLGKFRNWITSKSRSVQKSGGHLPCSSLTVTDVWKVNLPIFTTESPVRAVDIDQDGIEDVIFGFGTGNNVLRPEHFCPIFLGVSPPCDGGVIALNGKNGEIQWKHWFNDTIFGLQCSADINADDVNDCLAVGAQGTIAIINSQTGKAIWKRSIGKMNIFVANFVEDLNEDNVSDVITSHSNLEDGASGHVILFSGKTGEELKRVQVPHGAKTFFMPQVLRQNASYAMLLFGTGTPSTPGNLSLIPLKHLEALENNSLTLYQDHFKGVLTQAVLVDISGDKIPDIVTSMYNSSIVAINGKTYQQIWNYTIPNGLTDLSPTPGFFNADNVTDFLVTYQKYDEIFNYNYTQTLIIDGVNGKPIYQPISGGIMTQSSGLTLSMEGKGHDIFVFWTSECSSMDVNGEGITKTSDVNSRYLDRCKKQFNSTTILKLNGLNEFHQPPGIPIYNSGLRTNFEFNNTKSPLKILRDYLRSHPNFFDYRTQLEVSKSLNGEPGDVGIKKYGKSTFRHKDRPNVKDYNSGISIVPAEESDAGRDFNFWVSDPENDDLDPGYSNYNLGEDNIPYNQKQALFDGFVEKMPMNERRDPRSKEKLGISKSQSKKKNLSDKIYGYHNVRLAKDRLLHDEDTLPTDILKDVYFKNEESRLKRMKFEQRDVNNHVVGAMDDSDIKKIIEDQKQEALANHSTTLWDIENDHELREMDERSFFRKKRDAKTIWESLSKVSSVGAVLSAFNVTTNQSGNLIDIVFVKYWQPMEISIETILERDLQQCLQDKQVNSDQLMLEKECREDQETIQNNYAYFNQLSSLRLGQMTVYRLRIRCECDSNYDDKIKERCVRFLPGKLQAWNEYLGRNGDGVFYS
ncbi:hypothetical protein ABEB36_001447 [Hypothenemus hampei]|uniref:FAM234A/B beta-propeller domain-containing protein n=1 Tax=Hypothenemus hampei TaxID=57062 RepID=A0ABD1FEL0_HYPHA